MGVGVEEILHDLRLELMPEADDMVRDVEAAADFRGLVGAGQVAFQRSLDIVMASPAAETESGVERHSLDMIAVLLEQVRGGGTVDSPAHPYQNFCHLRAFSAYPSAGA